MVSFTVSKLGCTKPIFVEPGVKVDGAYYRDVLLSHQMLPAIRHLAGDVLVPQQDGSLAHRARVTVDYKIWSCVQEHVYQKPIRDVDQLKQRLVEV